MEKYKVIGWTWFNDENYPEIKLKDKDTDASVELAIIKCIREEGYRFCGDHHHKYVSPNGNINEVGLAPVLNSGERVCLTENAWGGLMAYALMWYNEIPTYFCWYYSDFEQEGSKTIKYVFPRKVVDNSLILPKGTIFDTKNYINEYEDLDEKYIKNYKKETGETFDTIFNDMNYRIFDDMLTSHPSCFDMRLNDIPFNQIVNGEKTIEIRLFDAKRKKIRVGDYIQFTKLSAEKDDVVNEKDAYPFTKFKFIKDYEKSKRIRVKVIKIHKFNNFNELFETECKDKSGFSGYTVQQAINIMRSYYPIWDEAKYGIVGIEFCVLKNE